jgi:hypothetical protein
MLQDLPQELHELITDNLPPVDYISYRNALGTSVGPYEGRKVDVQGEFRKEMKNSGMKECYLYRNRKDPLKINWKVIALLLGTKRVDLSEKCENNVDELKKDSFGFVLGYIAARLERFHFARLMGQWKGDQEDLTKLLVHCMSSECQISLQIIELLLADVRVDPSKNYAIRRASFSGRHECVALLLADKRVNPSALDNLAIRWASACGHHKCVALLLADERVDPTANNNVAIGWASYNGHDKCVALLWADPRVRERGVEEKTRKQIRSILAHPNS